GQIISIPFWISFIQPVFGLVTDYIGKRVFGLIFAGLLGLSTMLVLYFGQESLFLVVLALIIFGLYLTTATTYLYPTIPLL
ncbi:hypothetical protein IMG5_096390, partial [Ichthyophthirius multifiliis]